MSAERMTNAQCPMPKRTMSTPKRATLIFAVLIAIVLCVSAQPALPTLKVAWDLPLRTNNNTAFRLEWGTKGGFVLLPTDATEFEIPRFEAGTNVQVIIRGANGSIVSTNSSEIGVMNVPVYFEVNYGDGWKVQTSYWHTVENPLTNRSAMFRIRMEMKP